MAEPVQFDNVFAMIRTILAQWGLTELESSVKDMLIAGDSSDVALLKLRESEPYKKRFKANLARTEAGLPAMSEAEFLSTEASLKRVVQRYVGSGVYDNREWTDKLITGDVSAQELDQRMSMWSAAYDQRSRQVIELDDGTRTTVGEAWAAEGLTPADAIVGMMDPKITDTELKRRASSYALGASAVAAFKDTSVLNIGKLGEFVDRGVDLDRADERLAEAAAREDYEAFLARASGRDLTREEQMEDALLNDPTASRKRRQVISDDQARFRQDSYIGAGQKLSRDTRGGY